MKLISRVYCAIDQDRDPEGLPPAKPSIQQVDAIATLRDNTTVLPN
jgi:hypothetical protein